MIDPAKILAALPAGLRDPLLESYKEIGRNFIEHRWEPSELNGGKFSEVVFTIIDGSLKSNFAALPSKPSDMVKACRSLEMIPACPTRLGDRSLRILIPRMLLGLYEIRNNRNVGHLGGEVNPSLMDATAVYSMASWILAEIVRIFHGVTTKDAQEAVDQLVERKHLLVWEIEGTKRVLDSTMSKTDQTLVLLYSKPSWVLEKDLLRWVEYSRANTFRRNILEPLHCLRDIEYDESQARIRISPKGAADVERRILKTRV